MLNKVQLIGNLGGDPETGMAQSSEFARFSVATFEIVKGPADSQKVTEWHNVVCWGSLAKYAGEYLKKGSMVYVEGKIRRRSWTDKDNIRRYDIDIIASAIRHISKPSAEK